MQYFSTRGAGPVTLDEALVSGIAPDGGLFLPRTLPQFTVDEFGGAGAIPDIAARLLDR
jgi:threonine synthase